MRRSPRLRKLFKWTCLVLSLLLLVVWVGSGLGMVGRSGAHWDVAIFAGLLSITHLGDDLVRSREIYYAWGPQSLQFSTFGNFKSATNLTVLFIPLWPFLLLTSIATLWLWYRDRGLSKPRLLVRSKWTGMILSVLLLAVWIVSGWGSFVRQGSQWGIRVVEGRLSICRWDDGGRSANPVFDWTSKGPTFYWGFDYYRGMTGRFVWIPLWPLPLLTSATTVFLWRRDRRLVKPDICKKCRYDIRGLAVCPECGNSR